MFFVPIYSFRFLSSHSDGPCLIFTSIYINYASHYKRRRGGGMRKRKTQGRAQSARGSSSGNKKRIAPGRRRRRTQKTIRSDIRAITSVPRGLSTSSPCGGRNPTLIPAAFWFCFFPVKNFFFLNSHQDFVYIHTRVCVCELAGSFLFR
jgi:hypothetical protein